MQEHLKPGSVSVVVTSPPYNLGVNYSHYDDTVSRDEYLKWMREWAQVVKQVLSEDGSVFLNVGSKPTDPSVPFDVLNVVKQELQLQNVIHWVKSIAIEKASVGNYPGMTGDVCVGHYKPIHSPRFVNDCHEYIFHLTQRGDVRLDKLAIGVPYQDKSNVRRWKSAGRDVRDRGNTWFIPYETIKSRDRDRPHPATFPVKLAEMCIQLHGVQNTRLVLDPFLGIGQSALAARKLGVNFVGFEIDENYFQEAARRIQNAG